MRELSIISLRGRGAIRVYCDWTKIQISPHTWPPFLLLWLVTHVTISSTHRTLLYKGLGSFNVTSLFTCIPATEALLAEMKKDNHHPYPDHICSLFGGMSQHYIFPVQRKLKWSSRPRKWKPSQRDRNIKFTHEDTNDNRLAVLHPVHTNTGIFKTATFSSRFGCSSTHKRCIRYKLDFFENSGQGEDF